MYVQALLAESMVTLGSLARAVGPDHFSPELAGRCLTRGLEVARATQEPGTRRGAFCMFGGVAAGAGAGLGGGAVGGVVEVVLVTVQGTEGMVVEGGECALDSDPDKHQEEAAISVQDSYAEEKVSALAALKDLSANCGPVFRPWLDQCYREVSHLLNFPHYDVRAAAIEAW